MNCLSKYAISAVLAFKMASVCAQNAPPQYSLISQNLYAINPSAAGLSGKLEAVGVLRQQWLGLEGSPTTQMLTATLPISMWQSGAGLQLENDAIGARQMTSIRGSFNKIFAVGNGELSVGVGGGWAQMRLDGAKLRTPSGEYSAAGFDHRDQILPTTVAGGGNFLIDAGIFYQTERLSVGLSSQNLNAPKLQLAGTKATFQLNRAYLGIVRYEIPIWSNLSFVPSVLVRSDAVQTQVEWGMLGQWKKNMFFGVNYRDFDFGNPQSLVLLGGFRVSERWTLAYAHDLTLSALATVQRGTNEFLLKYTFGKEFGKAKLPPIIYNPRF